MYKCPFANFLDVGCPGCGTTRAIMAALRFDFKMAFNYHPLFLIPVICFLYTVFRDKLYIGKKREQVFVIIFLSMYLLRWTAYIINSADDSGSITIKTYDIVCYGEHAVVVLGITGTGADTVLTVAEGGYNGKTVNWGRTVSVVNEVIPVGNFAIIRREGM